MVADFDIVARQIDWADLYCRHNSGTEAYSESFAKKKIGSKPESVGVSKKNQDGSSSLNYVLENGSLTGLE